jgi:dipeptidyl aminopeptidase/acylaminoacyl peptidase
MRAVALAVVIAGVGSASLAQESHRFSVHDMLAMERITDPRVSPDGKQVAFTVRTTDLEANRGRYDVWLASMDGTRAERLTTHPENDSQARWAPDGLSLYFLSERSGSSQVHHLDLRGGEASPVTRLPLDIDNLEVSPDGAYLVFSMRVFPGQSPQQTADRQQVDAKNPASGKVFDRLFVRHWDAWENGTRQHLFSYRLADATLTDLMPEMDADCPSRPFGGSEEFALTPDVRQVVFSAKDVGPAEAWSTNGDLFVAPLDGSSAPRRLTSNPAMDTAPAFAPDGRTLAYLAMSRPGYESDRLDAVLREWPDGAERRITLRADPSPGGDRSFSSIAWSPDGGALVATADHLGQKALFRLDVSSGQAEILVGEGTVVSPQPLPDGAVLFGLHSLMAPTELFLRRGDGEVQPITHLNDERIRQARRGQPERFQFEGAGGDVVHGYLVRPADFDPAKKYPVAFLIHGGPQGSFGNDFHYRWNPQAYAGAGYAAVMIDFHGSVGYGQAFTDAINDDWGGKPFEDLMKGLDHALATYPFLDGDRVCALGASYGGYMINWIAGSTDRFRCLVNHDGNLDERAAYFDTEELWFPEWDHGGTPWGRPEGYSHQNPVERVAAWAENRTPMLVVHGGRDYRVVDTQGLSTFTALQRLGIPSRLLYFPDESHWVLKPANSVQWHEAVLAWLDRWIGTPR